MTSKLVTLLLALGVAAGLGTAAVLAVQDDEPGKRADDSQYKPGKGCGDPNRPHTGPPGNPDNTDCPPQSGVKGAEAESPRTKLRRKRLRAGRKGRVIIRLKCRTKETPCRGVFRLTKTKRNKNGDRVRVLLARVKFVIEPGETFKRKVRLKKAGRRMLKAKNQFQVTARTKLKTSSGPVFRRQKLPVVRRH